MSKYLYGQKKTHSDMESFIYKLGRGLQSSVSTTFTNKKLLSPKVSSSTMEEGKYDLYSQSTTRRDGKGGYRATMFVYVLGSLENIGFIANMATLVLYFHLEMHFDLSTAANTLTNFLGSTFLLTIVGGFISDTYLNRLYTCLLFGLLELMGLTLLTIQAYSDNLHPDACGAEKSSCIKGVDALMFYVSLCLMALGAGGLKGSLPALGADQFDTKDPKGAQSLASYFSWYQLSVTFGSIIGVTGVVYVSMNVEWYWGFFIGLVAAFVGFVVLALGKPFYRIQPLASSPIIKIFQVITVAIKNRSLALPDDHMKLHEIEDKERDVSDVKILHTNQFSMLDKAAIIPEGIKPEPWKVCTVTQVEEVKILTRMLPIIASTIIMNTCLAQLQTFSVIQGIYTDPTLGSLEIPTASIPVIPLLFMSILLPVYEFIIVPFARRFTGHPNGITQLQRVGVGLVLSVISMAIAGVIEVKRRNQFYENPLERISLFWLAFQYGVFGIADMFAMVGLMEFFYKEAPSGMRSLSTSFALISLSFGYFLSTAFVSIINSVTKKITPSKQGWLHGQDINHNNLNLFYWFLAIISALNFVSYIYCAKWYKCKEETPEAAAPDTEAKLRN